MSSRKKILILGGSGYVGSNLARDLSAHHSVTCTYRLRYTKLPNVEYVPFQSLIDKNHCKSLMQAIIPEIVIYAIGSNEIGPAERDPRSAQYLHTAGATYLQAASESVKAKFIYLSSDTVFSGHGGNFAEEDVTIPSTSLGKAKLGAENHIRGRSLNYAIIRSAPLLGRGTLDHPSWIDRMREHELQQKKFKVSERLRRNPIHISLLTEVVSKVIDEDLRNQILHVGGITKISEEALAHQTSEALGLLKENLIPTEAYASESIHDYSINFSQTLALCKLKALTLSESLNLLTSH